MKRHIDVTLRHSPKGADIQEAVRSFAGECKGWKLVRFIQAPDEHTGKSDILIEYRGARFDDPVHLGFVSSKQKSNEASQASGLRRTSIRKKSLPETLRLLTIVFQTGNGYGMPETNAAVRQFLKDFRTYIRETRLSLRVEATSDDAKLSTVIPSMRARRVFELFLSQYPLSGHPSDEERLNFFICTVFRCRAEINPDEIAKFLREDREWSERDASQIASRIWQGLDLLDVNRRLRRLEYDYFHHRQP